MLLSARAGHRGTDRRLSWGRKGTTGDAGKGLRALFCSRGPSSSSCGGSARSRSDRAPRRAARAVRRARAVRPPPGPAARSCGGASHRLARCGASQTGARSRCRRPRPARQRPQRRRRRGPPSYPPAAAGAPTLGDDRGCSSRAPDVGLTTWRGEAELVRRQAEREADELGQVQDRQVRARGRRPSRAASGCCRSRFR